MDDSVKRWAERWGLLPEVVRRVSVTLPDGTIFNFDAYLRGQADGTEWLREKLERQVGMHSFITTWLAHHKPYKRHPERTLKSFAFQEAESISREAKVTWCQCNGQAVISLQHDGIVVALAEGSDPSTVALQLQTASEEALGYEMPCTVKPPELPMGTT